MYLTTPGVTTTTKSFVLGQYCWLRPCSSGGKHLALLVVLQFLIFTRNQ